MGRKRIVPTGKEIFERNQIPLRKCEQCGATPAAFRFYANNKVLCNACKQPFLRAHLNKLSAGGVVVIGLLLWWLV